MPSLPAPTTIARPRTAVALLLALALGAVTAPAAPAASSLVIRGAGFGHGVGMSQYGALGYAQHGWNYREILGHYYTGTAIGKLTADPTVRVLLQSGHASYVVRGAVSAGQLTLDPDKTYIAELHNGRVAIRHGNDDLGSVDGTLRLAARDDAAVTLGGSAANGVANGSYRGAIDITRSGDGLLAVNTLGLERYVAGVVSAEVSASWPAEALRTQAVAARTYAVTTNAGGSSGLFSQYADTRSQMYRGVVAETPATSAAVNSTAHLVVTYQNQPVTTYFFSTSGGKTENVENSFIGSDPKPWLKGVDDPYDTVSPSHRWGPLRFTLRDATARLAGFVQGRLRRVKVIQRGASPRIVRAQLIGSAGTSAITGPQLRRAFGLRDSWILFRTFSSDVTKPKTGTTGTTGPSSGGAAARVADATGPRRARAASVRRRTLSGQIAPARHGAWATVERRVGTTWTRAVDVQLAAGGRYRTSLPGPGAYRVRFDGMLGPVVTAR